VSTKTNDNICICFFKIYRVVLYMLLLDNSGYSGILSLIGLSPPYLYVSVIAAESWSGFGVHLFGTILVCANFAEMSVCAWFLSVSSACLFCLVVKVVCFFPLLNAFSMFHISFDAIMTKSKTSRDLYPIYHIVQIIFRRLFHRYPDHLLQYPQVLSSICYCEIPFEQENNLRHLA